MTSVGDILRSARESQGRAMSEIAEELCITQRYLRALESDDLSNLPGTFFYKSFVKQYASLLGIPLAKIQPGIEALIRVDEPSVPTTTERALVPIRVPDPIVQASNQYFSNRRIGVPIAALAGVLLACSGFYSWWNQPPRLQARKIAPPAPVAAVNSGTQPAPASTVQVSTASAADSDSVNHVVLNLSATERTWLSITNSEGKQIFSGMLEPSQTKTLMASDAAQMKVGNAGGIDVRLNGKDIGPLGGRGEVRTVRFTAPDKFQIVEPPSAATDDAAL